MLWSDTLTFDYKQAQLSNFSYKDHDAKLALFTPIHDLGWHELCKIPDLYHNVLKKYLKMKEEVQGISSNFQK
jgi:hypothetical protein